MKDAEVRRGLAGATEYRDLAEVLTSIRISGEGLQRPRGSQYASGDYTDLLKENGIEISIVMVQVGGLGIRLGMPGVPLKVTTPRNPLYDAFLALTTAFLDGASVSNSLMRAGICLCPVMRRNCFLRDQ